MTVRVALSGLCASQGQEVQADRNRVRSMQQSGLWCGLWCGAAAQGWRVSVKGLGCGRRCQLSEDSRGRGEALKRGG